jgi:hypothetical protein
MNNSAGFWKPILFWTNRRIECLNGHIIPRIHTPKKTFATAANRSALCESLFRCDLRHLCALPLRETLFSFAT